MSVNAYRIIRVHTAKSPTFNLWHDRALTEFIEASSGFMHGLNSDGNGTSELPVDVLEQAVAKASELNLDADVVRSIKMDIAWAKRHGEECVAYQCY